jgi:hypothetical protein
MVWWRRGRRAPPPAPAPEEKALDQLQRLANAPAHTAREFAEALSALLRRYVAERFGLPAPRQTTAEFLEACRRTPAVRDDVRGRLQSLLERCDLAKYAAVTLPDEERQAMVQSVESFLKDCGRLAAPSGDNSPTTQPLAHRA